MNQLGLGCGEPLGAERRFVSRQPSGECRKAGLWPGTAIGCKELQKRPFLVRISSKHVDPEPPRYAATANP